MVNMQGRSKRSAVCLACVLLVICSICTSCAIGNSGQTVTPTPSGDYTFKAAFPSTTPLTCPDQASDQTDFVKTQHTVFTYRGQTLKLAGFTFYPSLLGGAPAWRKADFTHYIDQVLEMGKQAGQNLLRPTDFWNNDYHDNAQEDATVWSNMDYLVCAAQKQHLFVVLDVSAFRLFLQSQKRDRYDRESWRAYLSAVGAHYQNVSSIAFYSILGEPVPPKTSDAMEKLVSFYRMATDTLRIADTNHHLIMAGGFNHMNTSTELVPWWQKIYSLPNNDIGGFKTYSQDDLDYMSTVTAFTKQIGKPAFEDEFGMPQKSGDSTFSGVEYNGLKTSRAQFFADVYTHGTQNGVAGYVFWNMGCEMKADGYEISPQTPAVWQTIVQYAPLKPVGEKQFCK